MSTNYPGTITTFTDPAGTAKLSNPDHTQRHIDESDTIEAIQTVMGTTAGTSVLKNVLAGQFVATTAGTETLTNKTLTSPKVNEAVALTSTSTNLNLLSGLSALPTMQSKIIVATRDMTAASGDVAYTGVGFVPTSILALANVDGNYQNSIGVSDSALAEYSISPNAADTLYRRNALIWLETGAAVQAAVVKTYDADGFTLTWTKTNSPTGSGLLIFLCFR